MKIKININKIIYNNKFAIIFSFILSCIIWITVSSLSSQEYKKLVTDIPVTIPLSDMAKEEGLRIFSGGDVNAEIMVSGNRISMGMISKENIQVIARQATSSITSPGNYTLELTANKKGTLTNYDFSSPISPRFITVSVDRVREKTFEIENEIKYNSDPAYFAASTSFSETSVKISGPESKMVTIEKVVAKANIDGVLTSTMDKKVSLTLYDSYGKEINKDQLEMSVTEVTATIPILYKKALNVVPDFIDTPNGLDIKKLSLKIEPSNVEIAGPENTVKDLSEIKLSSLEFSKINPENKKFELSLNLPNGCRDMGNNQQFILSLDTNEMTQKDFIISKFSFTNIPSGKNPKTHTNNLVVHMVGLENATKNLNVEDIVAEIDLKDHQDYVGYKELPVKIKVKSGIGCWAYGKYTANVSVE